jgi:hypothetical protein
LAASRANEIAQGFMRRVGDPGRRQIAGAMTPGQFHRVAAVRLDPIAGLDRHQDWATTSHFTSSARQPPIQHVPCRARFVATRWRPAGSRFSISFRTDSDERSNLPVLFLNRDRNRFRVDIETDTSYVAHDRLLRMWLCVV